MDALDVKILNQTPVDDTSHDDEIEMLIPKYLKLAEEYCNQTFDVKHLPTGVEKFIAECVKYSANGNISSRSMGTVSYTFVTEMPKATYKHLKPFRKLRWSGYHV